MTFLFVLLTLLGLVTINYKYAKNKKQKKNTQQLTIQIGNAAQEGRYEWETHARYRPVEKKMQEYKMQEYKMHDKIEKKMAL